MTITQRRMTLAVTAALALLTVPACADDTGEGDVSPVDAEAPEEATNDASPEDDGDAPEGDSPDASEDTPDAGEIPGEYEGVLAAVELAVSEHDGAPAFEVDDQDDGSWEVHVAVGDDDYEVHVSADGSEVLSSGRESDLDAEDRDGLDAASGFTLAEAVRSAVVEYGGTAPIDDVNISEENGSYAWEVAFQDDVEVYLSIDSGELIRIEDD